MSGTDRDCVFGQGTDYDNHDWCDGPDAELEDDVAFGGICGDCYIERTLHTDTDQTESDQQ